MSAKRKVSKFIQELWNLLEIQKKYGDIICWCQSGLSFKVVDSKLFCETVLSTHFRHSNLSSFIRQLNMYNFHKVKGSLNEYQFYHQLFRKGHKELLYAVKRKPTETDLMIGKSLLEQCGLQLPGHVAQEETKIKILEQEQNKQQEQRQYSSKAIQSTDLRIESLNIKSQNEKILRQIELQKQNFQLFREKISRNQVLIQTTLNNFIKTPGEMQLNTLGIPNFIQRLNSSDRSFYSIIQPLVVFQQPPVSQMFYFNPTLTLPPECSFLGHYRPY